MFLPVIGADLLYIGNVHYEESSNADIDKDEDTSHIEPDSEKMCSFCNLTSTISCQGIAIAL